MSSPNARSHDYRVHRSQLARSVRDSEGFSVYDAIVDQIDWSVPAPWLSLLRQLNAPQRAVVAVAQVHEHAQFNGLEAALQFHGREVIQMAADGAAELGRPELRAMLLEALAPSPDWERLEAQWHREAEFTIEAYIEACR